jgi:hypothetical protein
MNYIVPCLSDAALAPAASSAFSDICDNCRQELVGELDTLMNVYTAMSKSHIKTNIMQKVVESVADVIQVLPPENVMAPLMVNQFQYPKKNITSFFLILIKSSITWKLIFPLNTHISNLQVVFYKVLQKH